MTESTHDRADALLDEADRMNTELRDTTGPEFQAAGVFDFNLMLTERVRNVVAQARADGIPLPEHMLADIKLHHDRVAVVLEMVRTDGVDAKQDTDAFLASILAS